MNTCATCRFFAPDVGGAEVGECRANAPVGVYRERCFPQVNPGDWCGQYEAIINAPDAAEPRRVPVKVLLGAGSDPGERP